MTRFADGWAIEELDAGHPRAAFRSGRAEVDGWLHEHARQAQAKQLSVTRVLVDGDRAIAGYFTLAIGQVDFGDLPLETARGLPRRRLPVLVLAGLAVRADLHGHGLGRRLLARALSDAHRASAAAPFIGVVLDGLDDETRSFYARFDFVALPSHPNRLLLPYRRLSAMMANEGG